MKLFPPARPLGQKLKRTLPFLLSMFAAGMTLAPDPAAAASGVDLMGIAKFDHYIQNSPAAPAENPERPFATDIFLEAASGPSVSAARISLPNQTVVHLEREEAGSPFWGAGDEFSNRTDRDSAFPNGTYTVTITTAASGNQQVALNLSGNAFPTPPRISNFAQAQAIDETQPFTISWDAFAGADENDFIVLGIEDPESDDEEIFHTGFLPATATSVELSAGLLQPERNYYVYLLFANVVDIDEQTFSGGRAFAGYFSETSFEISTQSPSGIGMPDFGIVKLNRFYQLDGNAPRPAADETAFEGEIFVNAFETETVSQATIFAPNGTTFTLEGDDPWDDSWDVIMHFEEASERDLVFPNGTYQFEIETTDGVQTVPLTLIGDTYAPAPKISNHAAAQAIAAGENFTLSWETFSGAGADDFIVIGIEDPMDGYETVFESDFLPPNSTSLEIPAGTLKPGRFYETWIAFAKVSDKNETAFAQATGLAVYLSETKTFIRTTALPGPGEGVDMLGVLKAAFYTQTSAGAPTLLTNENPFEFFAFTETTDAAQKKGVLLMTPAGELFPVYQDSWGSGTWELTEEFANQAELDNAYPNGTYTLNIGDASGGKFVSFNLSGNAYPQPLQIENFEALQNIDTAQPFTLSWTVPAGIDANDLIVVGIENSETGNKAYESAFLPGNTNSLQLPAEIFEPETEYDIWLILVNVTDTGSAIFPHARSIAGYAAETLLQFRTPEAGLTYENWAEQLPAGERAELADAGGRGIANLLRFAFGMDALEPARENLPRLGTASHDGGPGSDHLSLTFTWRKNAAGLSFLVEAATDLSDWTAVDAQVVVTDDGNALTETVTVVDPEPISDFRTRFLRVRVSR